MNKFSDIKDDLQSGDLILCSGNYPVSEIIKIATDSQYSHVGILYEPPNTPAHVPNKVDRGPWMVLESVEFIGVRMVPFEYEYFKHYGSTKTKYDGVIDIARYIPFGGDFLDRIDPMNKILEKAFSLIGRKYNNDEIMDIMKRILSNKHSGHPVDHGQYICSEYVYFCFKEAGINLHYDERGFVSPKNIFEDKNIELIYRDVR